MRLRLTFATRLAVVAAVAAGGLAATWHTSRPAPIAARPASDAAPAYTQSVTPRYLPAGATLVESPHDGTFPDVAVRQYALPGAANADTIPPTGIDEQNALTVHTATVLEVSFVPGVASVPPIGVDPTYFDIRDVTVAGLPALLSTPKNGFGAYRVDWMDAAGYHVVLCERQDTVDGTSGIPADELLRVADSLYA